MYIYIYLRDKYLVFTNAMLINIYKTKDKILDYNFVTKSEVCESTLKIKDLKFKILLM